MPPENRAELFEFGKTTKAGRRIGTDTDFVTALLEEKRDNVLLAGIAVLITLNVLELGTKHAAAVAIFEILHAPQRLTLYAVIYSIGALWSGLAVLVKRAPAAA